MKPRFNALWMLLCILPITLVGQTPTAPLRAHVAKTVEAPKQSPMPQQPKVAAFSIPIIDAPDQVEPGDLVILDASRSTNAEQYSWVLANSNKTFLPVENGRKVVFSAGKAGDYTFILATAGRDDAGGIVLGLLKKTVTVGSPEPPDPKPPTPDPEPPKPPKPPQPPGPTFGAGLKFVAILETRDSLTLAADVRFIIESSSVRATLTDKCSKTSGTPNWRFLDDDLTDEDLKGEDASLVAMYKYVRGERGGKAEPWVVISDGPEGAISYVGPLTSDWSKYVISK